MLDNYSGDGTTGPLAHPPGSRALYHELREVALRDPSTTAIVCIDVDGCENRLTYGEFLELVERISAGLAAIGVCRGDKLGLLMTNRAEWPAIFFAAMRIGAVVVPISTFLKSAEIAYVLRSSEARHLVLLDRVGELDFAARILESCPDLCMHSRWKVQTSALPDLCTISLLRRDGSDVSQLPSISFDELVERGSHASAVATAMEMEEVVTPDDLAMIKYTSGSTGFPKGVMLRQGPIVETGRAVRQRLGITTDDVFCTTAPMFHMSGSAWGFLTVMTGGAVFVTPELPDPNLTVDLMEKEKCTIRFGFPANYLKELEIVGVQDRAFHLRALCGRPPSLVEDRLRPVYGFDLAFSPYGITEAYGPVAVQEPGCSRDIQSGHTCGAALAGQELRIVEPGTGTPLPVGATGEICIRGRVMDGYWSDEAATKKVLDDEGWLHTEDLGWLDTDGLLRFVGRANTRLKVGGENVSVEEIERLIAEAPGVRDVVVVAVRHIVYGQLPVAFVQSDPGTEVHAIVTYCRERAAWYKVPKDVWLVDSFPLLGNGKPDRVELGKQADLLSAGSQAANGPTVGAGIARGDE